MTRGRTITLGMLWHSAASGNLGVTALTVANLALVRQAAARAGVTPRFVIIGPREHLPPNVFGDDIESVALDSRYLASRSGYWALLSRLDGLLDIGAGDSFADIYSRRRFAMIYATKRLARMRGKPLLFSPQTIGPFTKQPYRWLAGDAMTGSVGVVARDPASAALARTLAPRARVIEAVDVAFALPFEPRNRATDHLDVGLNISGLLTTESVNGTNRYGLSYDHEALFRGLVEALLARPNVRVHLICHVNAANMPGDDDGLVADRFARDYPQVIRVPDFKTASDAKSYISGLHMLVAGRMHACIAAFSSGVPVVPIAYSRKFSGLFTGVLGYEHILPVAGHDTASAIAFVLDRIDHRADLAEAIRLGSERVDGRLALYATELDHFIGNLI